MDVVPVHHEQFELPEAGQRGVRDPTDGVKPEDDDAQQWQLQCEVSDEHLKCEGSNEQ